MVDNCKVESAGILQCATHHPCAWNGTTIIGDRNNAGILHLTHFSEFFAGTALCDCPNRKYICETGNLSLLDNETCNCRIVINWIRVGHCTNTTPASCDCRGSAGRNRLFVFLTRFTQVGVQIYESRRDDKTSSVQNLHTFWL